jgi:histidyl-tRNA synthetase
MKYRRPRGTHDVVPPEIDRWRAVEAAFERTFDRFGYSAIRTPVFESTDLFVRAVGEHSDIVTREMYTFTDRGGRSITLRPENTASVIRAYLENGMQRRGGIQRLWYAGPMFRYDRPQAGRYRQFHQVGAEAIGSASPALDAEMIQLVVEALTEIGFGALDVRVNSVGGEASRGRYRPVLLEAIRGLGAEIDADALARYTANPLRVFDSKDYGEKLKTRLPRLSEYLVDEDAAHFARVRDMLGAVGVAFREDPFLVRGLDYYTRTVFEIYHGDVGAQSALCGGGRYDDLVRECGGPDTPAIGFSAGLERIIGALPAAETASTEGAAKTPCVVVCLGDGAAERALRVASVLRAVEPTQVDFSGRSRKTQIEAARKRGARVAVVVDAGRPDEVEWLDLAARTEERVRDADLAARARRRAPEQGDTP